MAFLQVNSKGQLRLSHRALLEEQNDEKTSGNTEAKQQAKDKEAKKYEGQRDGKKQERKKDEKKEARRQSTTRSDIYIVSKDSS